MIFPFLILWYGDNPDRNMVSVISRPVSARKINYGRFIGSIKDLKYLLSKSGLYILALFNKV